MKLAIIIVILLTAVFSISLIAANAQELPREPGSGACDLGEREECTGPDSCQGFRICRLRGWSNCTCDTGTPTVPTDYGPGVTCTGQQRPGSGRECVVDIQCLTDEYCDSGSCKQKAFRHSITCTWGTGGLCSAPSTGSLASPPECSETREFPQGAQALINPCTLDVFLTKVVADDTASISVNGNFVFSEPRTCDVSPSQPNKNATAFVDRLAVNRVTVVVEDLCAAHGSGETTRGGSADFSVINWLPNPGQLCVDGEIVPKCGGTRSSCGFSRCEDCAGLDGWQDITALNASGEPAVFTVCDGNSLVTRKTQQFVAGICTGGLGGGSLYGSCSVAPSGQTRTVDVVSEFCKYGCSGGRCNENRPPVISSVKAAPKFAGKDTIITINTTGSDPDTIYRPAGDSNVNPAGNDTIFEASGMFFESVQGNSRKEFRIPVVTDKKYKKATIDFDMYVSSFQGPVFNGVLVDLIRKGGQTDYFGLWVNARDGIGNLRTVIDTADDHSVGRSRPWEINTNYHVNVVYDTETGQVTARVTNLRTGQAMEPVTAPMSNRDLRATNAGLFIGFGLEGPVDGGAYYPPYGSRFSNLRAVFSGYGANNASAQTFEQSGVFFIPTPSTPTKRLTFKPPAGTYNKIRLQMDVKHFGWAQSDPDGRHNLFWFVKNGRNRDMAGYVFMQGPNVNQITLRHGFGLDNAAKPKITKGANFQPGTTYHFDYIYDMLQQRIELVVTQKNGGEVVRLQGVPNINVLPVTASDSFEIDMGFPGTTPDEPPNYGWEYSNLRAEFFAGQGGSGSGGNATEQARQLVRLACSSTADESGEFVADLCNSNAFFQQNPTCQFRVPWNESGRHDIFCRLFDSDGAMSSSEGSDFVTIDVTPPSSVIVSPAAGSVQNRHFAVATLDNDTDSGLARCEYRIVAGSNTTRDWAERTCSGAFLVQLPDDCPLMGENSCKVSIRSTDKAGNVAREFNRSFTVRYVSSNITSPADGSLQRGDFNVTTVDSDFSGNQIVKCEYAVAPVTGNETPALNWLPRECSGSFIVTVGRGAECSVQGRASCLVAVRSNNSVGQASPVTMHLYGIDFMTPFSTINSPVAGTWQSQDFDVSVGDNDPGGFGLGSCEYRVVSKGVEILPWRQRTCNAPVKMRVGVDCIDDGGDACTVFVRARASSGATGAEANRTFGIIRDPSVITDGFVSVRADKTDTGLNFSGVIRQQFSFPPTFISCSAGASPAACRDAHSVSGGGCGLGMPCFCGNTLENRCGLACNDRTVRFYLLASGFSGTERKMLVSNVQDGECPSFHINEILANLEFFNNLERDISILIMQVDFLMRNTNNNATLQELNQTLARLTEAHDIVVEHIDFIESSLNRLNVPLSEQILAESQRARAQVLTILNSGNFVPTSLEFSVVTLDTYRLNTTGTILLEVSKSGTFDVFANIACTLTRPDGTASRHNFNCFMASDSTLNIDFNANSIGTWNVACEMNRSKSSDCAAPRSFKKESVSFKVLPGVDSFITEVRPPSKAINGTNATIDVIVRNPDLGARYALVQCSFARPDNLTILGKSACTSVQADSSAAVPVSVFANALGEWRVSQCKLNVSSSSTCAISTLHNASTLIRTFNVTVATNMTILSLNIPPAVISGAPASIGVRIFSPSETFASATCRLEKPSLVILQRVSLCTRVSAGMGNLNVEFTPDELGTWRVDNCRLEAASDSSCLQSNETDVAAGGTFSVVHGTKLSITGINIPTGAVLNTTTGISASVFNPTQNALQARLSCDVRSPSQARTVQSSCVPLQAGNLATITSPFIADSVGEWFVDACRLEQGEDCGNTTVVDTRSSLGMFVVRVPTDPFIRDVDVNDFVINATDVETRVIVRNPTDDDRFVFAKCLFSDPAGGRRNATTECRGASRESDTTLKTTVHVDVVGTWSVSQCELFSSNRFDCTSAAIVHNITGPESFEVIRGSNLTFSRFVVPDVFNETHSVLDIQVRNPSSSDKFAVVSCSFRTPDNSVIANGSQCTRIPSGAVAMPIGVFADRLGTWRAECSVRSSLASDCSNAQLHDTRSKDFSVNPQPDLQIIDISLEDEDVSKEDGVKIDVSVRNPGKKRFGISYCNLRDPDNRTVIINDTCEEIPESATRTFDVDSILDVSGTWHIASCSVNASKFKNCTDSELHSRTNTTLEFNVTTKRLTILAIRPPPAGLRVGDIAIVSVDVKNIDRTSHSAFVNCTVINPAGGRVVFSTPNLTIQPQQVVTFTPRRPVDVEGTWSVQSCSVFRIVNSPSVIEDEQIIRTGDFFVSAQTQCDASKPCPTGFVCQAGACVQVGTAECSFNGDCPGTDSRCFCGGGSCVACPSGFICSDHQCIEPECSVDSDCGSGKTCSSGRCAVPGGLDSGATNLLIAALIIILIPVILFVFAKKVMTS